MASWRCRKLTLANVEVEMDSLVVRVATLALGLTSLLLLVFVLVGYPLLLGWGSRLALRGPFDRGPGGRPLLMRLIWPVAFFLLPGLTHILYSFLRPTSFRFRLLAWSVSLSLLIGFLLMFIFLAIVQSLGIETSSS